ncbi:MAG: glycosyltransferase [Acidimicrobiales bacterium]|nr:glycosyltransferase [Acidimicrobiales bacterium]
MTTNSISVGIVTYRTSLEYLKRCLRSIAFQSALDSVCSVLIRDNDNGFDQEIIEQAITASGLDKDLVKVINGDNIGFGAAQNELMKLSFDKGASAHLCLNPDAALHPKSIEAVLEFAKNKKFLGIFEMEQFPVPHPKVADPFTFETPWCSGCSLLIPSGVYETTKGFDESFWLYCEDVDLSWRVKAEGLHCYLVKDALVSHFVHARSNDSQEDQLRALPLLLAAKHLADKWGSPKFSKDMAKEYERRSGVSIDSDSLKGEQKLSPSSLLKAQPDFSHMLVFSPSTWIEG